MDLSGPGSFFYCFGRLLIIDLISSVDVGLVTLPISSHVSLAICSFQRFRLFLQDRQICGHRVIQFSFITFIMSMTSVVMSPLLLLN